RKHSGALQARYAGQVFAVLLPNMSESEMVDGASQLLKSLQRLHWPEAVNADTAVYLGAVCYQAQDSLLKVQEEAELALKSARLQGHSGWFLFEKSLNEEASSKGTVRWRTLISRRIEEQGIDFYVQPVQQERDQVVLQQELLIRLHDEQGRELQAGVFMPMAEKAGLLLPLDRLVVARALRLLRQRPASSCPISLSLCAQNLLTREFQRELFFELFQLPRSTNEGLILQLSESQVTRHYEALKRPLRAMRMLGCRLAIDHAGQDVVSTQYIKEFEIHFLKLHPSLVREIHLRQVNQMAVRSLVGGCANTQARVIAVGVESGDEWKMLRHLGVHAGQGPWFADPEPLNLPD
ncbi:EAL domain-containing protein, partial [Aeromonas caviae]